MKEILVAPSVLAADFGNLERDVKMINASEADYFHIDIMDGHFVPNLSFGFPVTKAISEHATKPMDFHLMILNPEDYLQSCVDTGAEIISVHYEVCENLASTVTKIKNLNVLPGVAINPLTPVSKLADILPAIHLVVVMSVNPGFGGQSFIENTYEKVRELRQMADRLNPELIIEIDGGVGLGNSSKLVSAGANMLVAGNSVFAASDPVATIKDLKES